MKQWLQRLVTSRRPLRIQPCHWRPRAVWHLQFVSANQLLPGHAQALELGMACSRRGCPILLQRQETGLFYSPASPHEHRPYDLLFWLACFLLLPYRSPWDPNRRFGERPRIGQVSNLPPSAGGKSWSASRRGDDLVASDATRLIARASSRANASLISCEDPDFCLLSEGEFFKLA